MGQSISVAQVSLLPAKFDGQIKALERLKALQEVAESKLDNFQIEMNEKFLHPNTSEVTTIPIIRQLKFGRSIFVRLSEDHVDSVETAIDDFFDISKGRSDPTLQGFKRVVAEALNSFIAKTTAGQHQDARYFVYKYNNIIVRLDVKLWRWNVCKPVNGQEVYSAEESCLCYVVYMSNVNSAQLKTSEFVYLISDNTGDTDQFVEKYISVMSKMYAAERKLANSPLQQLAGGEQNVDSVGHSDLSPL